MQRQLLTAQHQLPRQQRSERTQCLRSTTSGVPIIQKITAVTFPQLRRESRVSADVWLNMVSPSRGAVKPISLCKCAQNSRTKWSCAYITETISIGKDSRVMGQRAHRLGDTTPSLTCQRRAKQQWKPSCWQSSAIAQSSSIIGQKFYRQYQLQHNLESVEAAKWAMEVSTRPPAQFFPGMHASVCPNKSENI